MPFHLSAAAVANLTDRLCCSARRTLTAKRPASQKLSKLGVSLSRQNRTSGGSSETEEKELMVMPRLRPEGSRAVTTVTPVAKQPRTRRKAKESNVIEPQRLRRACGAGGRILMPEGAQKPLQTNHFHPLAGITKPLLNLNRAPSKAAFRRRSVLRLLSRGLGLHGAGCWHSHCYRLHARRL